MAPSRWLPSRTWNHFAAQMRILGKEAKEKKKITQNVEAEVPMEVDHANKENFVKETQKEAGNGDKGFMGKTKNAETADEDLQGMQKEAGNGDDRGLAEMEARMQSIIISQVEAMNRKWEKATGDALDVVIKIGRRNVEEKMEEVKIGNTMVEERLEIGLVNLEAKMEMGLGEVDNKIERFDVDFTMLKDFTCKIPGKVNKGFEVFDRKNNSLRKDLSDLGKRCDSSDRGTSKQSEKIETLQKMVISSVQSGKKDLEVVDSKVEKWNEIVFGSHSIYSALEDMKQEILESVDEDMAVKMDLMMDKMMCHLSAAAGKSDRVAKDEENGVRRLGSVEQEHRKKTKRKG